MTTIEQTIENITAWQNCDWVHEFTCGANSSHRPLKPVEFLDEVRLVCPDCSFVQLHVRDPGPPPADPRIALGLSVR